MKNFEINTWIEFVKSAFPNFNPTSSQLMMEAWQGVLRYYTLDEAKKAVTQYVVEKSAKYEPQPKEIAEILKVNKSFEPVNEVVGDVKEDEPEVRFHQDIELGIARHNLYIYRAAHKLVSEGKDWNEALEEVCLKRCGTRAEFPSKNELKAKGLADVKIDPKDIKDLLERFYIKGCNL